ncbi:DsbA family protein [bacterium]|nr:DsbA family protein [bacterium]
MKRLFPLFAVIFFVLVGCSDANVNVSPDTDVTYSKGNANAKVVITEYSDYQCPFSAMFTLQTLPLLQNDYIETGKVQLVFKDFPISNHQFAQKASEATYCAGDQDENAFWKMHVDLFSNQDKISREYFSKLVEGYGLNVKTFDACMDSDKYKNLILRNRKKGKEKGVTATPTIFINDVKLLGVQPYENLKKIIETELKK